MKSASVQLYTFRSASHLKQYLSQGPVYSSSGKKTNDQHPINDKRIIVIPLTPLFAFPVP